MTRRTRHIAALVAAVLGLLGALVVPASAQTDASDQAIEVVGIDMSAFPSVRLQVTLPPGLAASEMDPERIVVTENGEPVSAEVTPLAEQTVSFMLIVDTSGSTREGALDQAKAAVLQMLDVLPETSPVAVAHFGTTAHLVSDFTLDRSVTRTAVDELEAIGATALYDAVVLGATESLDAPADRRAMLVLTDGADSESDNTLAQAADAVEHGVNDFYLVTLPTDDTDAATLERLAESAGGQLVAAPDPEALAGTYLELGQRIVNQFDLTFTSTTPDPTGTFEIAVDGVDGVEGSVELALPDRPAPVEEDTSWTPGFLTVERKPAPLQQDWVRWVGAGLIGLALAAAAVLVSPAIEERRRQLRVGSRSLRSDAASTETRGGAERALGSLRDAATRLADRAVKRTESAGRIDAALDRAGLMIRSGEFVSLVAAVAVGAGLMGYSLLGAVGGLLGFFVPTLGAKSFLQLKASRRNGAFADQLPDALMIMAGSLRSGFGVGQALDTVAEEMDAPLGQEFQRAILETRLGRDLEDALDGIARRVENEDFGWVVDALRINRQVGGDLAQILDQLGDTIRARTRLKRQVAALTAEGKISALVLGVLPIGMGLMLYTSNREYMAPLFDRTIGLVMLGVAVGLLAIGGLWLKKMIDIEY